MKRGSVQSVIDLGKRVLKYCSRCGIMYNTTNANDTAFHSRIHKGQRVPRRGQIARDIYKQGMRYIYGRTNVEAWVELEPRNGLFAVKERWFSGRKALGVLMCFMETKYKGLLGGK